MSAMTGGAENGPPGELVPAGPPLALRWNLWATAVWCALTVLSNLVVFGQRPYLRKTLIDANAKAKTDGRKYVTDYTTAKVNHDVHTQLIGGLVEAVLVCVILLLLAGLTWRGRRWARWVLFALAVIGVPLRVGVLAQLVGGAVPSSAPGIYRAVLVLAGIAAVVVAVLLVHRTTRDYFAALRETQRGNLPAVPGSRLATAGTGPAGPSARPAAGGLGALFAPRRRPGARTPADGAVAGQAGATAFRPDADARLGNTVPNDTVASDDVSSASDAPSGAVAARRPAATRPGSVKAKGSGNRSGRFKSRQQ